MRENPDVAEHEVPQGRNTALMLAVALVLMQISALLRGSEAPVPKNGPDPDMPAAKAKPGELSDEYLRSLIDQMGEEDFHDREKAMRTIEMFMSQRTLKKVAGARKSHKDLEVRKRSFSLVEKNFEQYCADIVARHTNVRPSVYPVYPWMSSDENMKPPAYRRDLADITRSSLTCLYGAKAKEMGITNNSPPDWLFLRGATEIFMKETMLQAIDENLGEEDFEGCMQKARAEMQGILDRMADDDERVRKANNLKPLMPPGAGVEDQSRLSRPLGDMSDVRVVTLGLPKGDVLTLSP